MQTGPRGSGRVSPRDVTGMRHRANLAAQKARAEQDDSTAYDRGHKAGYGLGFDQGYDKGSSAGVIAGWDDAIAFVIDVGLVTQDAVDAAVDAHNAKLVVAGQGDAGDEA
ncbi:MAG TPA: hypothetical protein VMU95_00075 [Trebonia sp.]|nr:hypothetical protein [Trebonia sp.]